MTNESFSVDDIASLIDERTKTMYASAYEGVDGRRARRGRALGIRDDARDAKAIELNEYVFVVTIARDVSQRELRQMTMETSSARDWECARASDVRIADVGASKVVTYDMRAWNDDSHSSLFTRSHVKCAGELAITRTLESAREASEREGERARASARARDRNESRRGKKGIKKSKDGEKKSKKSRKASEGG